MVGSGIGAIVGAFFGGPVGAVGGAVAGSVAVEGLEYAEEVITDAGDDFFSYLAQLHNRIEQWAGVEGSDGPSVM